MQSICEQLLYEKAKNRRQLDRLKFVWIERDPILMQEAEFVRRTSTIGSVGSLELDEYMSSNASLHIGDDADLDDETARNSGPIDLSAVSDRTGPIDFDDALDRAFFMARRFKLEQSIDIASQVLSLLPPGKTTDEELDEMYRSGELAIDNDVVPSSISDDNRRSALTNQPTNVSNASVSRRPSSLIDDETSFAENDQSWLTQTASVVDSLTQVLDMQIYLTGDAPTTGGVPFARYGRPDIKRIFLEMKREAVRAGDRRVAVCVSAPRKLTEMCRKACIAYSDSKVRFDFHAEVASS